MWAIHRRRPASEWDARCRRRSRTFVSLSEPARVPRLSSVDPIVSIITPTFNHERYIRDCLESAIAQTDPRWEQLVIDDGSDRPDRSHHQIHRRPSHPLCQTRASRDHASGGVIQHRARDGPRRIRRGPRGRRLLAGGQDRTTASDVRSLGDRAGVGSREPRHRVRRVRADGADVDIHRPDAGSVARRDAPFAADDELHPCRHRYVSARCLAPCRRIPAARGHRDDRLPDMAGTLSGRVVRGSRRGPWLPPATPGLGGSLEQSRDEPRPGLGCAVRRAAPGRRATEPWE